ncbi:MAG: FecR domain-containing protein [Treponema sp.]|nr:FecR domain-containing protein [Treponema sp.]
MKASLKTFFLASFVAAFGVTSAVAQSTQMQAVVTKASGKAEVQDRLDPSKWLPLSAGTPLDKGAVIQTGFKSELELKIKGTTVTVAPLSRITLEQLVSKDNKDDTRIYLDTGSLKSNVKKTEDKAVGFKVRSPVATASVRGTVLEVKNKFRSTDVKTYEGSVAVWKSKNSGAKVASKAEDDAPAFIPSAGNSVDAITDGAPRGAFTVTQGQTAGFASNGNVTSASDHATKTAMSFPAVATTTASAAERTTSAAGGSTTTATKTAVEVPTSTSPIPSAPKTGSVNINVTWEE